MKKNLSPRKELKLWPSVHRSDALTTELRRTRGEWAISKVHVWYACVLRTARISNVEIAICVVKWRTMVNFKLGEEMRNDVINMSRARDNEKIWVPDRNWTSFLHRPYNLPSLFLYQRHFLGKADYLHVCAAPTAKTTSQEPYYLCFV